MMDENLVLKQASQVVEGLDRTELLIRINALLERHPGSLCAFIIAEGEPGGPVVLNITGNANQTGLAWLFGAALWNLDGTEWENDG